MSEYTVWYYSLKLPSHHAVHYMPRTYIIYNGKFVPFDLLHLLLGSVSNALFLKMYSMYK